MTTLTTPETPHLNSPLAYVHPKLSERGSYVQRWKALRDRNRNLPKLDFNTKTAVKYHVCISDSYCDFI
jgi:hypothetical protein